MMAREDQGDPQEPFAWDTRGFETTFVENLKALRERMNLSQTELAKRASAEGLQFHQPTIQRIERGERPVKLTEALILAQIVGSDLQRMMFDIGLGLSYDLLVSEISVSNLGGTFSAPKHFAENLGYRIKRIEAATDEYIRTHEKHGMPTDARVIEASRSVLDRLATLNEKATSLSEAAAEVEAILARAEAEHPFPLHYDEGSDVSNDAHT